jgi:hypothetical protein
MHADTRYSVGERRRKLRIEGALGYPCFNERGEKEYENH